MGFKQGATSSHLQESEDDQHPQVEMANCQTVQPQHTLDDDEKEKVTFLAIAAGFTASLGGLIFGYVSGEISGFFSMTDYARRFGQPSSSAPDEFEFSAARQGTIVGLVSIGALIGALLAGKMADFFGRRLAISASAFFTCVGTAIEISSSAWVQFAVGRLVTGLSIGAMSVVVPMYQSECSPAPIRGVIVASYQLLITLGIWLAELVNLGTSRILTSAAWRVPNGLSFAWALALGLLILLFPESPRFAYARGRVHQARADIARLAGVSADSAVVDRQLADIQQRLDEQQQAQQAAGQFTDGDSNKNNGFRISEIWTAPRMLYRTLLGVVLGAGQQLTGANYFFYYGVTIFRTTGIANSYVTQLVLGSVNVAATVAALWIVRRFGRRPILMIGAACMAACFLVFALVGRLALDSTDPSRTPAAGAVLVAFACLAIVAFAVSWGPVVWAVNSELYPLRYRSVCMGLATASNWFWNFLLSFFTRFITDRIGYLYGLVFAGCCAALVLIVFFFVVESKDRTLEEIDAMYVQRVNPITSASWRRADGEAAGSSSSSYHKEAAGRSTGVDVSPMVEA